MCHRSGFMFKCSRTDIGLFHKTQPSFRVTSRSESTATVRNTTEFAGIDHLGFAAVPWGASTVDQDNSPYRKGCTEEQGYQYGTTTTLTISKWDTFTISDSLSSSLAAAIAELKVELGDPTTKTSDRQLIGAIKALRALEQLNATGLVKTCKKKDTSGSDAS